MAKILVSFEAMAKANTELVKGMLRLFEEVLILSVFLSRWTLGTLRVEKRLVNQSGSHIGRERPQVFWSAEVRSQTEGMSERESGNCIKLSKFVQKIDVAAKSDIKE